MKTNFRNSYVDVPEKDATKYNSWDGWTDGQTDGQTERQTDRWTEGQTDIQTDRGKKVYPHFF